MREILNILNIDEDPFEHTDADQEKSLPDYFVPPPYFESVIGNPSEPSSNVVFAPRGSGKSAQRRMIEDRAALAGVGRGFLCVTYADFDQPPGFKLANADWAYHIDQINRAITLQLIIGIEEDPGLTDRLSDAERSVLSVCVRQYVEPLTADQYELATAAIRTLAERADIFWKKYGGALGLAISVVMEKIGIPISGMTEQLDFFGEVDASNRRSAFLRLVDVSKRLGYESVYVLVDRVDEINSTFNDPARSFDLIRSLVTDLRTLEAEGVAFKFFLWDELRQPYKEAGSRPDRISEFDLRWRLDELEQILSARLRHFSGGKTSSLNTLQLWGSQYDLHKLVARLAAGSPRDMLRLCARIIQEVSRSGDGQLLITDETLERAIWEFSRERSEELTADLSEISKVRSFHFTVNHLASDIFKVGSPAARARIDRWTASGVVAKVGTEPTTREGRPRDLYAVIDVRVGIATRSLEDLPYVLQGAGYVCPTCEEVVLSELSDRVLCGRCSAEHKPIECESLVGS